MDVRRLVDKRRTQARTSGAGWNVEPPARIFIVICRSPNNAGKPSGCSPAYDGKVVGDTNSLSRRTLTFGVWRSPVARFVRDEEVVGSNPATPTPQNALCFHVEGVFCYTCFSPPLSGNRFPHHRVEKVCLTPEFYVFKNSALQPSPLHGPRTPRSTTPD